MIPLSALQTVLWTVLLCSPAVHGWAHFDKTADYASKGIKLALSLGETQFNPLPHLTAPPPDTDPEDKHLYPRGPGAACSQTDWDKVRNAWNIALKVLSGAHDLHMAQMAGTTFTPNIPFTQFVSKANYKTTQRGRDPNAAVGATLFEAMTDMFTRMSTKMAPPANAPFTGTTIHVACYKQYWVKTKGKYVDECDRTYAWVETYIMHARGPTGTKINPQPVIPPPRVEFMVLCPTFFKQLTWQESLDKMVPRSAPAAAAGAAPAAPAAAAPAANGVTVIDYFDPDVITIAHELMHVRGNMHEGGADDLAYTPLLTRQLTQHGDLLANDPTKGRGIYSPRMEPPNADSEMHYSVSLYMDGKKRIKGAWGTAPNQSRKSFAEPPPTIAPMTPAKTDELNDGKAEWDGVQFPAPPAPPAAPAKKQNTGAGPAAGPGAGPAAGPGAGPAPAVGAPAPNPRRKSVTSPTGNS